MDKAARGRGSRSDAETRGEEKYVIEEIRRFFLFFFLLSFVRKFFEDARRCMYRKCIEGEGGMTRYLFLLSPNYLHPLSKLLYKERAILIVRVTKKGKKREEKEKERIKIETDYVYIIA